tara:strand:- start:3010 stop:3375 length:366 start_codon:yes stop_codon:yes gene_type:complete
MSSNTAIRTAAGILFLGVVLGAFGAHGLEERLTANGRVNNWETATFYHLIHGIALFVIALHSKQLRGFCFFIAGIILFSGSLYILALTGITKLGAITPLGGLCLLIGWGRWIFGDISSSKP